MTGRRMIGCCCPCEWRCDGDLNIETVTILGTPDETPAEEDQDECETCIAGTTLILDSPVTYGTIGNYADQACRTPTQVIVDYVDLCIADMGWLWDCCTVLGEIVVDGEGNEYLETIVETQTFEMCLQFYKTSLGVYRLRINVAVVWSVDYVQEYCHDELTGCMRCSDITTNDEECRFDFDDQGGTCPWSEGPAPGQIAAHNVTRNYSGDVEIESCSDLCEPIPLTIYDSTWIEDGLSTTIPDGDLFCVTLPGSGIQRCEPCLFTPTLTIQFGGC